MIEEIFFFFFYQIKDIITLIYDEMANELHKLQMKMDRVRWWLIDTNIH